MRIRADVGVGHPAADVWALLASTDGAACVPGLSDLDGDQGTLSFDVEARHLVFDGAAVVANDERARTVTVEARGVERSGRGKARVTLMLRVDDDGLFSIVNIEADLHLTGELSTMARLIAEAAYRIADDLAECLDACLGIDSRPPAEAPLRADDGEGEHPVGWLRSILDRLGGR